MPVRKGMSFGNFWAHLNNGFIVSMSIIVLLLIVGSLATTVQRSNRFWEKDFYSALRGQAIEYQQLQKEAEIIRRIYKNQFQDWGVIGESVKSGHDAESLEFAMEHWDKVVLAIEGAPIPDVDKIQIPTWKAWFFLFGLISLIILGTSLTISYVSVSLNDRRSFWTYPWNRWWGCITIFFMWPYLAIAVPVFLVCGLSRLIDRSIVGARELTSKIPKSEERISEDERKFQEKVDAINQDIATHRANWINVSLGALFAEKQTAEKAVSDGRVQLSKLGPEIEKAQRDIAEGQAKLKILEQTIEEKRKNPIGADREYDKLLSHSGIKAIEVVGPECRGYTDTIYITYRNISYKIGNFLVHLSDKGIVIVNLCNTNMSKKIHHPFTTDSGGFCFGDMTSEVYNLFDKRKYNLLFPLIIQILHTYDGILGRHSIFLWQRMGEVNEKEE